MCKNNDEVEKMQAFSFNLKGKLKLTCNVSEKSCPDLEFGYPVVEENSVCIILWIE
jgi:hypothetical protein